MSDYKFDCGRMSEKAANNQITETYEVTKHGAVTAIHLYMDECSGAPLADLAFAFGGAVSGVMWDMVDERNLYMPGINSYTLVYDDRYRNNDFEHYIIPIN